MPSVPATIVGCPEKVHLQQSAGECQPEVCVSIDGMSSEQAKLTAGRIGIIWE